MCRSHRLPTKDELLEHVLNLAAYANRDFFAIKTIYLNSRLYPILEADDSGYSLTTPYGNIMVLCES